MEERAQQSYNDMNSFICYVQYIVYPFSTRFYPKKHSRGGFEPVIFGTDVLTTELKPSPAAVLGLARMCDTAGGSVPAVPVCWAVCLLCPSAGECACCARLLGSVPAVPVCWLPPQC